MAAAAAVCPERMSSTFHVNEHVEKPGEVCVVAAKSGMEATVPQGVDFFHLVRASDDETDSGYGTPTEKANNVVEAFGSSHSTFGISSIPSTSPTPSPIHAGHSTLPSLDVVSYHPGKRHCILPSGQITALSIKIAPSTYQQVSDLERHCFSFFRHQTAPSFGSYFNSSIWRAYAIQAALTHPVVFSCAAAVGAVHRRHEYGISREAFEYCTYAANLHKQALHNLAELKYTGTQNSRGLTQYDRDMIMTSEMLLGLFESFQGEYGKTVGHVHNAIKQSLDQSMTLTHRESKYYMVEPNSNVFHTLFQKLDCSAHELFEAPPQILARWIDGIPLPIIPNTFASFEEARDFILTELYWIIDTPIDIWKHQDERDEARKLHVRRISQWAVSYAETVKHMTRTTRQNRACNLLKLVRNAAHLILYLLSSMNVDTDLPQTPHTNNNINKGPNQDQNQDSAANMLWTIIKERQQLVANLTSLKILTETNLDETNPFHYEEHSLSLDSAMGPPRRGELRPESSAKTRHMVKYLDPQQSPDDELWSILGIYGVAEKWSSVQEHAVISAIKGIIPETVNPKWVDISWMMESRKILMRYCRPDDLGFGLLWTQEWWSF